MSDEDNYASRAVARAAEGWPAPTRHTPTKGDKVVLVIPKMGKSFDAIVTGRWEPDGGPHLQPRAVSLQVGEQIVEIVAHRDFQPHSEANYWAWPEELT